MPLQSLVPGELRPVVERERVAPGGVDPLQLPFDMPMVTCSQPSQNRSQIMKKLNRAVVAHRTAVRRRGAVTVENVLLLAAIALPVVIFCLKIAIPQVRGTYTSNFNKVTTEADRVADGQ